MRSSSTSLTLPTGRVPPEATLIPGVKKSRWRDEYRIPFNAFAALGWESPLSRVSEEVVRVLLQKYPFRPGVADMITHHQVRMMAGLLGMSGHHAWAPPGAGKTLVGIAALCHNLGRGGRRLVITKAAARGTWAEQIERYTSLEPVLLVGQSPQKHDHWPPDDQAIFITAWETLKYWAPALLKCQPTVIVMDETHYVRRPKHCRAVVQPDGSLRFHSLENTLAAARSLVWKAERRVSLTATPIPGRVKDLWVQADLVEPLCWGSFHEFGLRYCGATHNGYGYDYTGMSNSLELRGRLALVKTKVSVEEVNQYLPRKRREVIRLSVDQQNKPASMKREIKRAAKRAAEDPDSFFEALLMEAASRKHTYIEDRVLTAIRSGQKVVVFTGRRLDCERLADKLKRLLGDKVPKAQVWWGHGGVDTTERDEIRREYMASPGPSLLVGTGDAWGESIDLQDTDLAIIAMLPWTPDKVIQWEGRFSRLGQKRPVLVSYIIARNTADDHVADLLIDKLPHVGEIGEDSAALEIEQVLGGVDESDEARQSLLERVSRLASP